VGEVLLVRVDDRLVHGQTVVAWVRHTPVDTLLVVDDATASNPILQKILKSAAPGFNVIVVSIADAISKLKGGEIPGKIMVIVRSPTIALPLWDANIDHWPKELNVGALGGKPGARQLDSHTYLLPGEIEAIEQLSQKGVRVYFQMVPGARSQEWAAVRSKFL
jgi:PTS system mannose-specific IIB component